MGRFVDVTACLVLAGCGEDRVGGDGEGLGPAPLPWVATTPEPGTTVCGARTDPVDLQAAIDAAEPGARIDVCPGTYGPITVRWGQQVEIVGLNGRDETFIDGNGQPAVDVDGGTLTMRGFTVRGDGYDPGDWQPAKAGGLNVFEGTATFRDLIVERCTGPFALLFDEDWLVLDDVVWRDNETTWLWFLWQGQNEWPPGGPPPPGSAVITDNLVLGGVHEVVVETVELERLELHNTVFWGVTVQGGRTAFSFQPFGEASLNVSNNVFYDIDDTAPWGGRLFGGAADLRNNIVAGCDAYDVRPFEASYSLFWDLGPADVAPAVTGVGNRFDLDPQLADPDGGDFGLLAGSPAIDAGDPDPAFDDDDGTRNDIGATGGPRPEAHPHP